MKPITIMKKEPTPKDTIQQELERFDRLFFPSDGFICRKCNYVFKTCEGCKLACQTEGCNGVLETPYIYMKNKAKSFLKESLERIQKQERVNKEDYRQSVLEEASLDSQCKDCGGSYDTCSSCNSLTT